MLATSLQAETRIPEFDYPVWSAALARARQYVSILTKQLTALRTGMDHHRKLETEIQLLDEHYDSPLELPDAIPTCSSLLRKAKKAVSEMVASSRLVVLSVEIKNYNVGSKNWNNWRIHMTEMLPSFSGA